MLLQVHEKLGRPSFPFDIVEIAYLLCLSYRHSRYPGTTDSCNKTKSSLSRSRWGPLVSCTFTNYYFFPTHPVYLVKLFSVFPPLVLSCFTRPQFLLFTAQLTLFLGRLPANTGRCFN